MSDNPDTKALSPVETLAVAKVVSEGAAKKASSALQPGEYPVDFMLHVLGSIKKGANYERKSGGGTIQPTYDPWLMLATAVSAIAAAGNLGTDEVVVKLIEAAKDPAMAALVKPVADAFAIQAQKNLAPVVVASSSTPVSGPVTGNVIAVRLGGITN